MQPGMTQHARRRCAQRGISSAAIVAAMDWGLARHVGGGCTAYFLGDRAVSMAAVYGELLGVHRGVTVIVNRLGRLVTAYVGARPPAEGGKRSHIRTRGRRS